MSLIFQVNSDQSLKARDRVQTSALISSQSMSSFLAVGQKQFTSKSRTAERVGLYRQIMLFRSVKRIRMKMPT